MSTRSTLNNLSTPTARQSPLRYQTCSLAPVNAASTHLSGEKICKEALVSGVTTPFAQRAPTSCSARALKRATSRGSDPKNQSLRLTSVVRTRPRTGSSKRLTLHSPRQGVAIEPHPYVHQPNLVHAGPDIHPQPRNIAHSRTVKHHHQGRPRDKAQPSKPTSTTMTTMRATLIAPYNYINLLLLHHHHHH